MHWHQPFEAQRPAPQERKFKTKITLFGRRIVDGARGLQRSGTYVQEVPVACLQGRSPFKKVTSEMYNVDRRAAKKATVSNVKAVVRDLGKTKNGKQKAAKEARKIVEMKGKQIKDELSLAMIQLFTKLLDEDSVEASTIDDVIQGPN